MHYFIRNNFQCFTFIVIRKFLTVGVVVPDYWDAQPLDNGKEKTVHLVQLDAKKWEYKKVEQLFLSTQPGLTIVKIERVQNPELSGIYAIKKKKMDEHEGSNEKWLFHGTAGNNVTTINAKGFNRSYAGAHGECNVS